MKRRGTTVPFNARSKWNQKIRWFFYVFRSSYYLYHWYHLILKI
jgi:hypothetical protein